MNARVNEERDECCPACARSILPVCSECGRLVHDEDAETDEYIDAMDFADSFDFDEDDGSEHDDYSEESFP